MNNIIRITGWGIWILKFNLNIEIQHTNIIISNNIDIFNPQCSKTGKIVYWFQNLEHTVPLFMLSRFFPEIFHTFLNPCKYFIYFSLVGIDQAIDYRNWKKSTWVFVFQNYGKFWRFPLEHYIKHDFFLISEECFVVYVASPKISNTNKQQLWDSIICPNSEKTEQHS